jgi:hypothetical protein
MVKYAFIPLTVFLLACSSRNSRAFIPYVAGYNESKEVQKILPDKLKEVSGIFYLPDGQLAAINDEEGQIFFIDFEADAEVQKSISFGSKADYEEILKIDSIYWVMESNGDLYEVAETGLLNKYKSTGIKKIEFESMYHDLEKNRLVLISKDHKKIDKELLAFEFDLATRQFNTEPVYKIPTRQLHFHLKNSSILCKPSAAAIHPVLNKLFIIASVGKVLFQCTLEGKVEKAYRINPVKFQQPEGITFAPNGDMYISNEAGQGKATLLKFPYAKPQ